MIRDRLADYSPARAEQYRAQREYVADLIEDATTERDRAAERAALELHGYPTAFSVNNFEAAQRVVRRFDERIAGLRCVLEAIDRVEAADSARQRRGADAHAEHVRQLDNDEVPTDRLASLYAALARKLYPPRDGVPWAPTPDEQMARGAWYAASGKLTADELALIRACSRDSSVAGTYHRIDTTFFLRGYDAARTKKAG